MCIENSVDILEFIKAFYDKPGPLFVDTHIKSHEEGIFATTEEDVWKIGKEGKNITFADISRFFKKVIDTVDKIKGTTFFFEGIKMVTRKPYKAQLQWGT